MEPRTLEDLADDLRFAYFDDPTDDTLLRWENVLPQVQERWLRVAGRANEMLRGDLTSRNLRE